MTQQRRITQTPNGRPFWLLTSLMLLLLTNSGCSVYMAAKQPGEKDLTVLKPGTDRSYVIAELGAPTWSGEKNGEKTDIFIFKQGYSTAARTGRALFHGTADVFSLGLWEVVSTPTEAYFSGSDMKVEVVYDSKDLVKTVRDITTRPVEPEPKPSNVVTSVPSTQPSEAIDENSSEARTPNDAEP